jgi:hypothetical protein
MPILERVSDRQGAAIVGWLAPRVLYARFGQTISAGVGERFARRFAALVGETSNVRYFADSGEVVTYDLMALRAIVDAMLANRWLLAEVVVRPWAGELNASMLALPGRMGCMEYVTSGVEFDARLAAAGIELRRSTTLVDLGSPPGILEPGGPDPRDPDPADPEPADAASLRPRSTSETC